jgi:PilZ domain
MQRKRRSGRIAKELDIVLLGTDTTGKVFSEQTKTVVLSRHGAGVVTRYRFSPDELLTLRLPGSDKEAAIRLVGQIGGESGRYIYGVAFVDPDPDFWPMKFPPPDPFEPASAQIALECSLCQARQEMEQGDIEEDVYSVNGNILRFCAECGTSTPWKKASVELPPVPTVLPAGTMFGSPEPRLHPVPARTVSPARPSFNGAPTSPPPVSTRPTLGVPAASFTESFELGLSDSPVNASAATGSSYSGASTISEFASMAEVQVSPVVASAAAVLSAPEPAPHASRIAPSKAMPSAAASSAATVREFDANGRPVNKRRHVRIRVSFSACVRHAAHADEVVECENVSKGGVCFHSLQQYEMGSLLEIAAPYSPGEKALFVRAQIKRVEPLSGGKVFRYGVEYVKPSSGKPHF